MNRRLFLSLVAAGAAWSSVARAIPRPPGALTRLRLVNAHTGETFEGSYRDDKGPIDRVMDELCIFLRDHHSGEKTQMDVGVIDFLADVLDSVGETKATVLSAYRTPQTNAMLSRTTFGVAEHSQHIVGRALDIRLDTRLPDAMSKARAMRCGGVGWYPQSGFIHIDSGPVRNWTLDERGLDGLLLFGGHRKPDGLMVFDGHRQLDGKRGSVLLGGPWRPLTVPERIIRQRRLARAEFLARTGGLRLSP
ncbi:MAG: DUF882 domain-containing protein [Alphaproteobacteria bacterium]|nr:DUF882 domain-containing protein [Alphaproteobacteria bacterium]